MEKTDVTNQPLLVSASPHIRDTESIPRIMWSVVVCLAPASLWGLVVFGWYAGLVVLVAVGVAVITEGVLQKLRKVEVTLLDGSAVVTGLLLALVLPPNVPLYVAAVGAFVAIAIAKHAFGGLGYNIWNPALVGRAFVQLAYADAVSLSRWPIVKSSRYFLGNITDAVTKATEAVGGSMPEPTRLTADAISQPSPLGIEGLKALYQAPDALAHAAYSMKSLFFGLVPGSIGEVSVLLLFIGGIYLVARRYIKWQVPLVYIVTVAVLTFVLPVKKTGFASSGFFGGHPLYQMLSGGLFLGAFFMATDMVTTPLTVRGNVIFALGCGILTALIRLYGGYPEGVCYSILLMNTATPLIDRFTRPRVFGARRRE